MMMPDIQFRKILYSTDLSESARHAFAYAVSLASRYDAGITMLHVLEEQADLDEKIIGYVDAAQWEAIKGQHEAEARQALIGKRRDNVTIQKVLDQFCQNSQAAQETPNFIVDDVIVSRGNPAAEILSTARAAGCDLIVMGTHGQGTFADAMMGSTARRVVRRSDIPVLVIRLPDEASTA
jgi:nucleotide-binding universal stress UspA family protein